MAEFSPDLEELEAVARAIDEAMRWGPRSDHDWAKLWRAREYEGTHGHHLHILATAALRAVKHGSDIRPSELPSARGRGFWALATEVSESEFELWLPGGKVVRVVTADQS